MNAKKIIILFVIAIMFVTGCIIYSMQSQPDNVVNEDKLPGDDVTVNEEDKDSTNADDNTEDDKIGNDNAILEVDCIMFIENVKPYLKDDYYMIFDSMEIGEKADEVLSNYLESDSYEYEKAITVDQIRFINAGACLSTFDKKSVDDIDGVSIKSLMDGLKIRQAKTYIVVGKGNFTIGVAYENLDGGILYKDDEVSFCIKFDGMSDKTIVKDVLYISVEQ